MTDESSTETSSAMLPAEACDTHMHFYNGAYRTSATTVLRPPDATVDQYRDLQAALGCRRVVVVQPTTYGLDNSCQLDAMAALTAAATESVAASEPADCIRGIAVVNGATTTDELSRLHDLGVRGARFHMLDGGAVDWDQLETVAATIAPLGWHIQLQLNGRELAEREALLRGLPVELVVDHVGRFMPPVGLDDPNFGALWRLLQGGRTWVKVSAPYESSVVGPPDYADTAVLARALLAGFPQRMLWATNWPHPGQATHPSAAELLDLVAAWIPDEHRRQVLVDNPATLYGFTR